MTTPDTRQIVIDATLDFDTAVGAAADELAQGRTVVIPTDTVYGIAAPAKDTAAVASIFAAKNRPAERRVAVLVADLAQAGTLVEIDGSFAVLADRFWPGPLTLVAARKSGSPTAVGSEHDIGVRCPDHDLVRELARRVGPLATTSANVHGRAPHDDAASVATELPAIGLVIDGGLCRAQASTVVDLCGPVPKVLRAGLISQTQITEALAEALAATPQPPDTTP